MTEGTFKYRDGKVYCKCGAEMESDSDSPQYSRRRKCTNPECRVQVVTVVWPNPRRGEDSVRFRDVKTCVVTT